MTPSEADEQLAQAIRAHAEAYGLSMDGELLGDYAVVINWLPAEENGASTYTLGFVRPSLPTHVARGLFHTALGLLDQATSW